MNGFIMKYRLGVLLVATWLMLGLFLRLLDWLKAGEQSSRAPVVGSLLVARPDGTDRNFEATVVLLVAMEGEHTVGLVLNRLKTPQGEALPAGVARWGGPVSPEHLSSLVRAEVAPEGSARVLEGLHWVRGLPRGGPSEGASLTYSGLAVWAPEQLAQELAEGGWWVLEGGAESVFAAPDSLWALCLMRARH